MNLRVGNVRGCATGLAIAELTQTHRELQLVLTDSVASAERLAAELQFFMGSDRLVLLFPDVEVLPYDNFSPHQDLAAERLRILADLRELADATLIAAAGTLLPRLPPAAYLRAHALGLMTGQRIEPGRLRSLLDDAGYQRVSQVSTHGEYAVRGSLIDFFPTGSREPVRVDFLDDEIESIREFNADTQLTLRQVESLQSLPAREIPIDPDSVRRFRQRWRERFEGNPAKASIYREVSEQRLPAGVENYLPLFFDSTATLWDYLPEETQIISTEGFDEALADAWKQVEDRYEQFSGDPELPLLPPNELFCPVADHTREICNRSLIRLQRSPVRVSARNDSTVDLSARPLPPLLVNRRSDNPADSLHQFLDKHQKKTLFTAESPGRREILGEFLRDHGIEAANVDSWGEFHAGAHATALATAPLVAGVILESAEVTIITESDLFGEQPRQRRSRRSVRDPESLINDLTNLSPGSPVVHVEHGVGRYRGLTDLDIDDAITEFVTLEYADGDLLHVPVSNLQLISRYTGAAPEQAPLHRLGTDQWARARRKAAEKIRDAAAELLELYARRASRKGQSLRIEPEAQLAFAAAFPFQPTDDQADAIDAIMADLSRSEPMDRLVCGDVGFGKTEVALRAAHAAVTNHRQVAVLVPTTLLAQQHHQTFADRFADWPVRVETLSRFRSGKESASVQAGLADGTVDIVIGTHRLLQQGIQFKDLGLVIVDEEHRFGVRHKEQLKALRAEADFLTLTATPIPRTLNMALGGLRDLSLITTPPRSRLSIKTFVTEWEERLLREACLREIKRGGQVYFVHNRVEDIEKVAQQLAKLVPEANIEFAHGQMRERELERLMLDFYQRRFHILVCTAIIESGLDVPTANTIIINRADRFGLAQLHQLRGRVGRSHHQAFAYLLTPPRRALTPEAVKRLDAIESLEDLGAGFVLATHDLEIRGAGELLGEEQSGQIQQIGFSLYSDMLAKAVETLRAGGSLDHNLEPGRAADFNLHLPALIPDTYLPDVHLRLVHYKRIASAPSAKQLEALQVELIDRFGLLPEPTQNLFRLARLRLAAVPLGLKRVDISAGGGRVEFGAETEVAPATLVKLLESEPAIYSLDAQQRLRIRAELNDLEARFCFVENLIQTLAQNQA